MAYIPTWPVARTQVTLRGPNRLAAAATAPQRRSFVATSASEISWRDAVGQEGEPVDHADKLRLTCARSVASRVGARLVSVYVPDFFRQRDRNEALSLVREVVLGELVTWDGSGLVASEVPMLYEPTAGTDGSLLGHLARANPQWRSYVPRVDALAIFRGPQAYVSPSWYPSKAEHGKVAPTWDYATVHVRGELIVHDDVAWKRSLVTRLTTTQESPKVTALGGDGCSGGVRGRSPAGDCRRRVADQSAGREMEAESEPTEAQSRWCG